MNIIDEIEEQYFELERRYSAKQFIAIGESDEEMETFWANKRDVNAHAYFLFLFTRLEDFIKNESDFLINDKIAVLTDWKEKAIWEISNDENLHFKKRLCLLAEKGKRDYNKISEYYVVRNEIAHGGTIEDFVRKMNMQFVFEDFKKFFIRMKVST